MRPGVRSWLVRGVRGSGTLTFVWRDKKAIESFLFCEADWFAFDLTGTVLDVVTYESDGVRVCIRLRFSGCSCCKAWASCPAAPLVHSTGAVTCPYAAPDFTAQASVFSIEH